MTMLGMQTKFMRDMHKKMMRAHSPEAPSALKSAPRKLMQDAMAVMGDMASGGMNGMK